MIILSLALVLAVVLSLFGTPVAYAFGIAGIITAIAFGMNMVGVMQVASATICSLTLLALPLYIIMGTLAGTSGLGSRLITIVYSIVGRMRGGLGTVVIMSNAFFGAISGSAAAAIGATGSILIPEMVKRGYARGYAMSLIASTCTLSLLIPPSLSAIIFGILTQTSVAALFLAGIPAAGVMIIILLTTNYVMCRKMPTVTSSPSFGFAAQTKEFLGAMRAGWLSFILPFIILGFIYGGVCTPTEAAAIGAIYCILASIAYRSFSRKGLLDSFLEGSKTTGAIVIAIFFFMVLSRIIMVEQIPNKLLALFVSISDNKYVLIAMINLTLIVLGMIMDDTSAMIIGIIILMPVALELGMSPYQFYVMIVVNVQFGCLTPPVAPHLFMAARVGGGVPISEYWKPALTIGCFAFLPVTALVAYVPIVPNILPDLYMGMPK